MREIAMSVSDGHDGEVDMGPQNTVPLNVSFIPRPATFCAICRHGIPAGIDTCTTCLADYGLPMPGVA